MKIFIIPTSYPDKDAPQKDIFIYEQAKELARRGHEITVLHVKKLPSKKIFSSVNRYIEKVDDGFANRYVIRQKTFMEGRIHSYNREKFVESMKVLFERATAECGYPDVIYAHFTCWAGYAAAILSKENNIPLVVLEHYGGFLGDKVHSSMKKGVRFTLAQAKAFLCVSQNLKEKILKFGGDIGKIDVLSNMVDRKFQYVAPTKKKEFIFSSIGNLNKGKDFSRLIDAFCMAFDTGDSVMLRIGGGGPEKEKLQAQIDKLGRGNQIRLLGRLDREQTILEYINCDAFALASQFETFGMVYREALVTGRPIVTTNHGGFSSDDWSDEFGIMVPVRDTYALSKALRQLYTNYSDYNGMMISQKCHEQCSADLIGDKIEMLLSNVQN